FGRRGSILLLNLESQVRLDELPWVAAIDRFRTGSISERALARQALQEMSALAIAAFPFAILPNKLCQEFRALATGAELDIALVDELAADIFVGRFSEKFVASARLAADFLDG